MAQNSDHVSRTGKLCSACAQIKLRDQSLRGDPESTQASPLTDAKGPFAERIQLGTLALVYQRRSACDLCRLVTRILDTHLSGEYLETLRDGSAVCELVRSRFGRLYVTGDITDDHTGLVGALHDMSIDLLYYDSVGGAPGLYLTGIRHALQPGLPSQSSLPSHVLHEQGDVYYGRRRSPHIDTKLVRFWLDLCQKSHAPCVFDSRRDQLPKGFRLIDVKSLCIVQRSDSKNGTDPYVALSYVWGGPTQKLVLTLANESRIVCRGGVSNTFSLDELPNTVADAINLVRSLDFRYLWVDALCIIQDSKRDQNEQIGKMNIIYEQAILTLVAASADNADSGIPGISSVREAFQEQVAVEGGSLVNCCLPLPRDPAANKRDGYAVNQRDPFFQSKWNSRGWTFQEGILSRRCLIVSHEQVYWECRIASWCEERRLESSDRTFSWEERKILFLPSVEDQRVVHSPVTSDGSEVDYLRQRSGESQFYDLVKFYSQRSLSYDSDALNAFTGILQGLWTRYGISSFQGLLEHRLHRSLWWHNSLKRRQGDHFPSWSWLAWKDPINMPRQETHVPVLELFKATSIVKDGLRFVPAAQSSTHFEPSRLVMSKEEEAVFPWTELRDDFHLVFYAEAAHLQVASDGVSLSAVGQPGDVAANSSNRGRRIGSVYDGSFQAEHEFILVEIEDEDASYPRPPACHLLLITWNGAVAQRLASASIDRTEWRKANPQRKLVVLG